VACGNKAKCDLAAHIAAHEDRWVYPKYKDYNGQ